MYDGLQLIFSIYKQGL